MGWCLLHEAMNGAKPRLLIGRTQTQVGNAMSYSERHSDSSIDAAPRPREDGWMVTPRAVTMIATIITILYSLHAPVRYVLGLANSVESLSGRVAALEAIAAREAERAAPTERREQRALASGATRSH